MKSISPCVGCRDNYYNGKGAKECWMLAKAKLVKRWRLGWWTPPTERGAFLQVETYNCHRSPGNYAHYEKLPDFAVDPIYMKDEQEAQK